jgi:hypothetical protein
MEHVDPQAAPAGSRMITYAAAQPEYRPLVGYVDPHGVLLTEWVPSAEDLAALLAGGRLRLWIYTFNRPLQPIMLEAAQPDGAPASELDVDPQRKRREALELFVQRVRRTAQLPIAAVEGYHDIVGHLMALDGGR